MAEQTKVLGQRDPAAATLEIIYTVTAPITGAVVSSIVICNRSLTPTEFRIAVSPAGAAISDEMYQYFDRPIPAVDTFVATIGIGLEVTDVIRVYATLATVSFTAHGLEIT